MSKGAHSETNVLLLGETGKGKSTLINVLANYFLRGSLDNLRVVIKTPYLAVTEQHMMQPNSESNVHDKTKSNTRGCWNYKFVRPSDGAVVTIIDTPGLGDTEGIQQDEENIAQILQHTASTGSLSAIVIIFNGAEPRIGPTVRMVLERLAGNLPDVIVEQNLVLVLTKTTKAGATFSVDAFSRLIAKPREVFYMDNTAFSNDPSLWRSDPDLLDEIEGSWKRSMRVAQQLVDVLVGMRKTSTTAFMEMYRNRDSIKAEIAGLMCDIKKLHTTQEALEALQHGLAATEEDLKKYENFKKTETVTYVEQVPADYYSTVCMTHIQEKKICHDHCGLKEVSSSGNAEHFSGCACMSGSKCGVCGCGPATHYHARVTFSQKEKTVESIMHETKAMYDQIAGSLASDKQRMNTMAGDLQAVQALIGQKRSRVEGLFRELKKICSRFNFVNELNAVIGVMRHEAQTLRSTQARNEAERSIKHFEVLADKLTISSRV